MQPHDVGSDWVEVSGKLKCISVGDNIVVGANEDNEMYIRVGMCLWE